MKTARITIIVERPIVDGIKPEVVDRSTSPYHKNSSVNLPGCRVIGEPRVEIDKHERCEMTAGQLYSAMRNMSERGGGFVVKLAGALAVADSSNRDKIVEAFHDLIWGYVEHQECR